MEQNRGQPPFEPIPAPAPRARTAWWAGLAAVAWFLVFTAWVVSGAGAPGLRTVLSDVAFLPVALLAAGLAIGVSRRPDLDLRIRRAWRRIGLSFLCWWAGDVLWFVYEVVLDSSPFPSWADLGYLSFYPMLLWGLVSLPSRPRSRAERLKLALDGLTVMVGAAMAVWYLVVEPTVRAGGASRMAVALSLAYPVGDLVLLFGVALVLLRGTVVASATALRWLVAGAAMFVVADVAYARLSLNGGYEGGSVPDVFWMAALVSMVLAAAARTRAPASGEEDGRSGTSQVTHLPYLAVVGAYVLLLLVGGAAGDGPLRGLVLGSVGLTALVLARQVAAIRENASLLAQLRLQVATDSLTGLLNRRGFAAAAEREVTRSARYGGGLAAVMLDIDHFKRINDDLGHSTGDEVIAWMARLCRRNLRAVDILARYGGDELVAILPETRVEQAVLAMDRLRADVAAHPVLTPAGPVHVSFSAGVAGGDGTTALDDLLRRADAALYAAKQAGRGCTRAGELVSHPA